jgi:cation diffusion facilitator family transporter
MDRYQKAKKTALFSIVGNILLATVKLFAGIFGNSYALIADAIESTTDIFSSILVYWGIKYAERPPDENHPYGHGKIEPLVTFIVVGILITSATIIAYQAIINIQSPQELPESWTLGVLLVIILWKEIAYQIMKRRSEELKSTSIKADAWHQRSDAITSVAAFLGISIALLFGEAFAVADDWAALFSAFFILYNSYLIFRPALGEIMDEHFHEELQSLIHEKASEVPGVINTEKCYVRKAGMDYQVDLHARVDGSITVEEGHTIAHALQDHLLQEITELKYVLIHIEPGNKEA